MAVLTLKGDRPGDSSLLSRQERPPFNKEEGISYKVILNENVTGNPVRIIRRAYEICLCLANTRADSFRFLSPCLHSHLKLVIATLPNSFDQVDAKQIL